MDIKNLNVTGGRAPEQVKVQERTDNTKNSASDSAATDKVTLTGASTQILDLEQKTANLNIDNSERIASLKAAIADGSYQVNEQNIAEKLMQTENLLANI